MIELAGIVILGIVAQWVAWRMKLPAILPLILDRAPGGAALNPVYGGRQQTYRAGLQWRKGAVSRGVAVSFCFPGHQYRPF